MKIYTAATFREQKRIRAHKEQLIQLGHSVLSTWLEEQVRPDGMTDEQFGKKMAVKDLQEIRAADCVILDLENPSKTMGKMVEWGFALAHHKLMYAVGVPPVGSIFIYLADKLFKDWEELLAYFRENHKGVNVYVESTPVNTPKLGEWKEVTSYKELEKMMKRK